MISRLRMSKSITVISVLTFFLNTPIRSYHSTFFHGYAHRNGVWSPWESDDMDASTESMPKLSIWSNQYYVPHYCEPASWPVVSEKFRQLVADAPNLKFLPVEEERTIDYAWKVGELIKIEPGNLGWIELFKTQPAVKPTKLGTRHEMVSNIYRKVIGSYAADKVLRMEMGSPPSPKVHEYRYSDSFLTDYPIHCFGGSMVFTEEYWKKIEPLIDKTFFNIRTYELESE
jgi:hypothetical protein